MFLLPSIGSLSLRRTPPQYKGASQRTWQSTFRLHVFSTAPYFFISFFPRGHSCCPLLEVSMHANLSKIAMLIASRARTAAHNDFHRSSGHDRSNQRIQCGVVDCPGFGVAKPVKIDVCIWGRHEFFTDILPVWYCRLTRSIITDWSLRKAVPCAVQGSRRTRAILARH